CNGVTGHGQHGGDEILGGGLTGGTGQRDHGEVMPTDSQVHHVAGQLRQSLDDGGAVPLGIVGVDVGAGGRGGHRGDDDGGGSNGPGGEHRGGPLADGGGRVFMAVHARTGQ